MSLLSNLNNKSVKYKSIVHHGTHTCNRCIATDPWSALTLQAIRRAAVDPATSFDEAMSFSSVAFPCTMALADSHKLCVAVATSFA